MSKFYIGVDVGTASVRACVVHESGKILATSVKEITIWNPQSGFYQQSSNNIWNRVTETVKTAISKADVKPESIKGIGVDATCSLVVLDDHFKPLTISPDEAAEQNVIMWMDHRAQKEAKVINATKHDVLKSVGGIMSLEMQPPKLMWLKQNLPSTWESAGHFFDLPDFLTWRATGSLSRSLCSLVCKWTFQADGWEEMRWDKDFLSLIGLNDLTADEYSKIGTNVQQAGFPCGSGLSQMAAEELGLAPGTPVGTSLIDAHAGTLACLGCAPSLRQMTPNLENCLVLIAGTSTCHMICSKKKISVPGVWGPYFSAIIPDMWNNEGGQSAAGSLIDFVTSSHSAFAALKSKAQKKDQHPHDYLNDHLQQMALAAKSDCLSVAHLTQNIHMWPDFHGNRSPVADSSLKGMVCGLSLSATEDDLALLYLAAIQALAYGTKHIVTEMEKCGHVISMVYMCGGLSKNPLYVQTHTDVLGKPMVLPAVEESVLLGAAMLGACASGNYANLQATMSAMGGEGAVTEPDSKTLSYHQKKFEVFLEMLEDQRKYGAIMSKDL